MVELQVKARRKVVVILEDIVQKNVLRYKVMYLESERCKKILYYCQSYKSYILSEFSNLLFISKILTSSRQYLVN